MVGILAVLVFGAELRLDRNRLNSDHKPTLEGPNSFVISGLAQTVGTVGIMPKLPSFTSQLEFDIQGIIQCKSIVFRHIKWSQLPP